MTGKRTAYDAYVTANPNCLGSTRWTVANSPDPGRDPETEPELVGASVRIVLSHGRHLSGGLFGAQEEHRDVATSAALIALAIQSTVMRPHAPRGGEIVLAFLLPKGMRQSFPGDLEEEFRAWVPKMGLAWARVWYWWQVIRCAAWLLPGATALAAWWGRRAGG